MEVSNNDITILKYKLNLLHEKNDNDDFFDEVSFNDISLNYKSTSIVDLELSKINQPKIPKKIFIVPYRDRGPHKLFFTRYMKFVLEDEKDYEIYFIHQCDKRSFNRGAMKNIGFIEMKKKYPDHYKDITFIFNDIDTIPCDKGILPYNASKKVVEHYFGFDFALGGIFAIKGEDFENINGFPNNWGWGFEDNTINDRFLKYGGRIDRKIFYKIGDIVILHFNDMKQNYKKKYSPNSLVRSKKDDGRDGIRTIRNLSTKKNGSMFDVNNFNTLYSIENEPFLDVQEDNQQYRVPNKIQNKKILLSENNRLQMKKEEKTQSFPFQMSLKNNKNMTNFMGLQKR